MVSFGAYRMKLKVVIIFAGIAIVAGACYGIYSAHHVATVVVPNAYAVDWASEFVVEHLKSTENQWPQGWDDLRDEYDRLAEPDHYPWSWSELQNRVTIDWDADPDVLVKADPSVVPPFEVIRLSDGSASHWEGSEPNLKVLEFLMQSDSASGSQ